MTKLLLVVGLCSLIPGANAQQATMGEPPTSTSRPETGPASQPAAQEPAAENQIPPELRPGHALDPADVDILTGKRDREIEAARQTAALAAAGAYGEYGYYGDYYWMNGRLGPAWDIPMLPLARITNPFFFSRISPRGFGRGGFRVGR
jgi:hypothetical protein